MRKLLAIFGVLTVVAFPAASLAGGLNLDPSVRFEFTDCSSSGSASQAVTEGTYLFRVTTEDVWLCWATTCAAGGEKFGSGMAVVLSFGRGGQDISCRSAGSTGDAIFTRATQ